MVHLEGEVVINRTPEEQKKCSTSSPMNATNPGTTRRCTSPRRYRTGRSVSAHASRAQTVSMGRPVDMAIEVTGYERPHRLGITTQCPRWICTAGCRSTRLLMEPGCDGPGFLQPSGMLRMLSPLVANTGRRQERTIWTGLEDHLEAPPN
jgi:hypothetical protein